MPYHEYVAIPGDYSIALKEVEKIMNYDAELKVELERI